MVTTEVLTRADRARVQAAIADAEKRTRGEIFVVVARQSDDYTIIPIVWATLIALLAPAPLLLLTALPASLIYLIQLLVFIVLALVLALPAVKPWVVPERVKHGRVRALAVEMFLAHGLHTTEARTGVLIFLSLMEKRAEIVADTGIAALVPQANWDAVMAALVEEVRAGRLADGLIVAISGTGADLARHFPPPRENRDELPNDVIIL